MQAELTRTLKSLVEKAPLNRFQRWAVVALVLLLCAGAGIAYKHSRPGPVNVSSGGAAAATRERFLTVHVAGAVANPGLYKLGEGTRVADALARAGGPTPDAALDDMNLAGKLQDGQKVMVPRTPAQQTMGATPAALPSGHGLINVNTATAEQLDSLPGVGPSLAQKIILYRTKNGPFSSLDDLDNVGGIGPAKLDSLKDSVTF
jgi:competence protein ComEA